MLKENPRKMGWKSLALAGALISSPLAAQQPDSAIYNHIQTKNFPTSVCYDPRITPMQKEMLKEGVQRANEFEPAIHIDIQNEGITSSELHKELWNNNRKNMGDCAKSQYVLVVIPSPLYTQEGIVGGASYTDTKYVREFLSYESCEKDCAKDLYANILIHEFTHPASHTLGRSLMSYTTSLWVKGNRLAPSSLYELNNSPDNQNSYWETRSANPPTYSEYYSAEEPLSVAYEEYNKRNYCTALSELRLIEYQYRKIPSIAAEARSGRLFLEDVLPKAGITCK